MVVSHIGTDIELDDIPEGADEIIEIPENTYNNKINHSMSPKIKTNNRNKNHKLSKSM